MTQETPYPPARFASGPISINSNARRRNCSTRSRPASGAVAEVNAHYHGADAPTFALHDAQLVLARAYGFESWPKLKAFVDGVTVRRLVDAVRAGDIDAVASMLRGATGAGRHGRVRGRRALRTSPCRAGNGARISSAC